MLIPTGHEDLRGRRWPLVSMAIIALNFLLFLGTNWTIEGEMEELSRLKLHILLVAGNYPDVEMQPEVREFVEAFQRDNPKLWARIGSPNRPLEDEFDAAMRSADEFDANGEMARLGERFIALKNESLLERFAFIPASPSLHSYVTANFLHGGWMHIIFNMWFLWLAGTVLEDRWGRPLYAAFYMLAGIFALVAHEMTFPHSTTPVVGASGAVAGLMGGFLVRYFKTRINFLLIYFIGFVPRVVKFQSPAWFMLPLWFLTQIFWALLLGNSGGVAFWAHIGGFAFGVGGALLLQVTGLEKRMDAAIEKEVTWQADPRVVRAGELMEKHQLDEAMAELRAALAEKPGLLDAHNLLIQATWRKQDMPAHREAIAAHIHALVKAKDLDTAWQDYQDFLNAGGESIAACDWIVLCRYAESKEDWERAASEYEKYAAAWPQEKMAVYALVSAARLRLKKLDQREEAARLYRAAESSPVPHIEWQDAIKRGLYEATSAS